MTRTPADQVAHLVATVDALHLWELTPAQLDDVYDLAGDVLEAVHEEWARRDS